MLEVYRDALYLNATGMTEVEEEGDREVLVTVGAEEITPPRVNGKGKALM